MLAFLPNASETKKIASVCYTNRKEMCFFSSTCTIKFFPLLKWGKTKMSKSICFAPFR